MEGGGGVQESFCFLYPPPPYRGAEGGYRKEQCITLVHLTSAWITRLTTFKVNLLSSSFSIQSYESIVTWVTFIMLRRFNSCRRCLWNHVFMLSSFLHATFTVLHYLACKTIIQQHTPRLPPKLMYGKI